MARTEPIAERLFLGPLPKPRRVQVAFAEPIAAAELTATPEEASRLVDPWKR